MSNWRLRLTALTACVALGANACASSNANQTEQEPSATEPTEAAEPAPADLLPPELPSESPDPQPASDSPEATTELAPPGQPDGAQVSDAELVAFAQTYREVAELEQKFMQQIAAAADDAKRDAVAAKAQSEVQQTIKEGELPPRRFLEIISLAERDPQFAKRVQAALESTTSTDRSSTTR